MGVGLRRARRIKIDDVIYAGYVETPCSDIRGNQNVEAPLSKSAHRAISLALRHVALEGDGSKPVLRKLESESLGPMLGPRKNDRCSAIILGEQSIQKIAFAALWDRVERMIDSLRRSDCFEFDDMGSIQNATGKVPNRSRHRRREQEVLSVLGQSRKDPLDVGQESHVEHVIGFVEHERLDLRKIQLSLLQQVEYPPRTAHHDLGTPSKRSNLGTSRDTTEYGDGFDLGELREQF